MTEESQQVYFSYAWGGDSERVAAELDTDLRARGIGVIRDKAALGYKGTISTFMQEIGRGKAIVVVICDKYLKSPNCMFELVEIAKSKDVHDRIFPVVLQDADIYDPVNRIKYIKHWEDKLKALDDAMRTVSLANQQGLREEIDSYAAIREHVSGLTFLLKDMNTLTPEMHENSNFASLISELEKRLQQAGVPEPASPAGASTVAPPGSAAAAHVGVDAATYLADIGARLAQGGYQPLKGERFGPLRFKAAFEKVDKGFLSSDRFRVLVVEQPGLNTDQFQAIESQVQQYAREQYEKENDSMFVTCVVLTDVVPDELRKLVYDTPPPKLGLTDGCISAMVVYSAADNDITYPTELLDDLGSNFEDNIKKYLAP